MNKPVIRLKFSSGPLHWVGIELILVAISLFLLSSINQEVARIGLILWLFIDWARGLLRFVFRQRIEKRITHDEEYWVNWQYSSDEWSVISEIILRRYWKWLFSLVLPLMMFILSIIFFAWRENPTWFEVILILGITLTIVFQLIITRMPARFTSLVYTSGQVRIGEPGVWVAGPVKNRQIEYFTPLPGKIKTITLQTSSPAIMHVESVQRLMLIVHRYYADAVVPEAHINSARRLMEKLQENDRRNGNHKVEVA